ncbi:NAD(P)-binding protein [Thozetella sp. PMI_491]|nr:NAD(P)-binding protein [Thozetella sp. PMI_491]
MGAAKRIVVCGGNGFLGSRICKSAVARGWDVTSISRSGEPRWKNVTSSPSPPSWARQVSWERADIFKPVQYASLLKGADFVVHSMGILLESDYKGVVSGRESPIAALSKAFSSPRSGEPVKEQPGPSSQLTYEMMNRDSAILLAKEAMKENVKAFGYISAVGGAPVLPSRYITTKREAESIIASEFPEMRSVYIRAPILYDSSRPITVSMAALTTAGHMFNDLTRGALAGFLGSAGTKPSKADDVAEAVVEALSDDSVKGPLEPAALEELATKAWRKTML